MGKKQSKSALIDQELKEFSNTTHFTYEEVQSFYHHFRSISALEKDDGVIDYSEFCQALNLEENSALTSRIFDVFDTNADKVINFREFIMGISLLIHENFESQIKLTFQIFDKERVGQIKSDTVYDLLENSLAVCPSLPIPKPVLKKVVDSTFADLNKDYPGKEDKTTIDYYQFRKMITENPNILKWLSIDLDHVKDAAKLLIKNIK